jgi:carbon-monoxide dehydrogenase large subunit
MKFGIGQPVRRIEDSRFVTGSGQYTDDLRFPREIHAVFMRSPHAHARIAGVDATEALRMPGVVGVLTAADVTAAEANPMPCMAPVPNRDGTPIVFTPKPLLAEDKVTFVGEALAMVVAETLGQAKDAAEKVAVDYEPLPAVGTLAAAHDGPQIWDGKNNLCFDWAAGDEGGVAAAFAAAAHTASVEVVQNRVSANPMETRNAIGLFEDGRYTLYSGNQGSGNLRGALHAVLGTSDENLRVICKDVGGGFGMKGFLYPEQALVLIAAKKIGRPVRWSADRNESFLADDHGRDMAHKGEVALDRDGKILALRITGMANMGGYLSLYAPFIPTLAGGRIFGGVYRVPAFFCNIKGYFTNTAPVDAYRGAGRPEAAYLIERLMDVAAAKAGLSREDIRRRNLPGPEELPYANWFGVKYDSGNYPWMLEHGLAKADWDGFETRRKQSLARGRLRGRGFGYYVEITFSVGSEPATVKFTDNGAVELYVGTQSNGQGHETAFAQMLAERLGVPFESITVKQGDTEWVNGGGTGGSRSLNMAGGALNLTADEVIHKGKLAAGQVLQAGSEPVMFDTESGTGTFKVGERGISIGELAITLRRENLPGFETGLDSDSTFRSDSSTFPNGCHVCEVEVDPDTGKVDIVSYSVLDDFGRIINPMLVRGQVQGGVVQGLGQGLLEDIVYDSGGQLLTASFTDYAMPRADDMPDIQFAYEEILCKTNALGAKGCGEAGTVGAMPALMGAVADAIGVAHIDMPATPERVWRAMQTRTA